MAPAAACDELSPTASFARRDRLTDVRPTAFMMLRLDELKQEAQAAADRFAQLLRTEVPKINDMVRDLPEIPVGR